MVEQIIARLPFGSRAPAVSNEQPLWLLVNASAAFGAHLVKRGRQRVRGRGETAPLGFCGGEVQLGCINPSNHVRSLPCLDDSLALRRPRLTLRPLMRDARASTSSPTVEYDLANNWKQCCFCLPVRARLRKQRIGFAESQHHRIVRYGRTK